jgi:hypothetical protein
MQCFSISSLVSNNIYDINYEIILNILIIIYGIIEEGRNEKLLKD